MKLRILIVLIIKKIKLLKSQPKTLALFYWNLFKTIFLKIVYFFSLNRVFTIQEKFLNKLLVLFFTSLLLGLNTYADYTVASGANINAASLVGQSGVLTINGTITLSSNVTLSGFTSVIINAPNGEIYWSNNSNLTFSVGCTISINTSAPGLQASGSNGAQRLYVGNAIIAVSSDKANNADFSFAEFNQLGGLPQYNSNANSNVCSGSAITSSVTPVRTVSGVAYDYSWSITPSSGTFIYNSDKSIANISPSAGNYTITCVASANTYETTFNFNVTVIAPYTWKGINTNWNDAANWCPGIPGGSTSVTISSGVQSPIISSGNTASVNNLTIANGASLTVNGTLQVAGSLSNSGTLDAGKGTIEMKGAAAQTIAGSLFDNKTVKNLIISNTSVTGLSVSSTVTDTLKITGALTFGNGTSKLNTGDNITLVSDSFGTARVGIVGAGNTINGKVIAEKYINTGTASGQHAKSWQFLSVPTSGQTIKQSWMENGATPGNYGTMISGPAGIAAGFDITSAAPSMKYFVDSLNNWKGISTTNDLISNTGGYMVFIRGDRTVTTTSAPANSTVLRNKGTLFLGDQLPIKVKAHLFQSIGNPYASPIDFSLITKDTTIDDAFYVYDPYLYGTYGVGGYQTLSSVNNWKPVPGGTSSYPTTVLSSIIQSGQAFFVHSHSDSNGVISITENCKSTFSRPGHSSRIAAKITGEQKQFLRASLITGSGLMADGNVVAFDKTYRDNIDGNDVLKMLNSGENFGIKNSGKLLTIEAKSPLSSNDTIFYNIGNLNKTIYQLAFAPENLESSGLQAFLLDKFMNAEIPVSLSDSTFINITVTSNAASSAPDRFKIVFRQMKALPVTITSVSATAKDAENLVQWNVANESGISQYEVEKSTDGNHFNQIVVVNALNSGKGSYFGTDKNVVSGTNYYRIKVVSVDGKGTYSQVLKVINGKQLGNISVYPNPISDDVIHLQLNNQPAGIYKIKLYNSAGQILISKNITHPEGSSKEDLKCDNLPKGIYQLQISNSSDYQVIKIFK